MKNEIFKKGDKVYHFVFGWGSVTGDSEKGVCDVVFENRESVTIPCKEIHLSFCKYDLINGGLSHERPFGLEVGKSYVAKSGSTMIIDRLGYRNNFGFYYGGWFCDLICSNPQEWREATDEEVRSALEKETIRRFGENWKDVKIKEDIHPIGSWFFNEGKYIPQIKDTGRGWLVFNKNGYLFFEGVWAEKLEESEFKPFQNVLVRDRDNTEWEIDIFSYIDDEAACPYICMVDSWGYCIPYEGNEHLLGTSKSPEK